ncbi:hypothetical protein DAEQUDRAFT_74206 [Daedalea quercina L-15889]|uniref:Uncharacterized protein n=1 Tax=Daedalea quercina L-15889 TaxID=1314783 RepID=A0A165L483_9APHY|nr:hypothetical protein DAEQUDRAFT_74206 [Daedalea quercina L-15889]
MGKSRPTTALPLTGVRLPHRRGTRRPPTDQPPQAVVRCGATTARLFCVHRRTGGLSIVSLLSLICTRGSISPPTARDARLQPRTPLQYPFRPLNPMHRRPEAFVMV